MRLNQRRFAGGLIAVAAVASLGMAGCSSSTDSASSSPSATTATTATTTASPTSTGSGAACTSAALAAALPSGSDPDIFVCNSGYAGVDYDQGSKQDQRAILKDENGSWVDVTKDVCGAASAGVPAEVLAYCDASIEPSGGSGGGGDEKGDGE